MLESTSAFILAALAASPATAVDAASPAVPSEDAATEVFESSQETDLGEFNDSAYFMVTVEAGEISPDDEAMLYLDVTAEGAQASATPPAEDAASPAPEYQDGEITIPESTGVRYMVDGQEVSGTLAASEEDGDLVAHHDEGYVFSDSAETTWSFDDQQDAGETSDGESSPLADTGFRALWLAAMAAAAVALGLFLMSRVRSI